MDWYEEFIEEPVREVVKLLRNSGFNTICSCGHEMYIQCDTSPDGEFKRLHDLLYNNGYRDYHISFDLTCIGDCPFASIEVRFGKAALKEKP